MFCDSIRCSGSLKLLTSGVFKFWALLYLSLFLTGFFYNLFKLMSDSHLRVIPMDLS
jgi:hypothetical protein